MKRFSSNIEKGKLILFTPQKYTMNIHKLLKMTYKDISEFFGLQAGSWQPSHS